MEFTSNSFISPLFGPSGGIRYHLKALWYQKLWRGFVVPLNQWLMEWNPGSTRLVLVGPSAGYTLFSTFLHRFEEIIGIEPDPIARLIFESRFRKPFHLQWSKENFFTAPNGHFHFSTTEMLFLRYPKHAFLFCNFLGQLKVIHPDAAHRKSFAPWKREFSQRLNQVSFASYHDRVSGPLAPQPAALARTYPGPVSDEQVQSFYPAVPTELVDHLTGDLCPSLARRFFSWEIVPGQHHLIEAFRR